MLPAFIDIEASSLSEHSYPVEIGIALPSLADDGWRITVRSWLVRPTREWQEVPGGWDPAAEQVHGLSLERLLTEGLSPAEVAAELDAQLRGRLVVADTGRHAHDAAWLSRIADAIGDPWWPTRWRLARETSRDLIVGLARRSGVTPERLAEFLRHAPPHPHSAGEDALREAWFWAAVASNSAAMPTVAPSSVYRRRHA